MKRTYILVPNNMDLDPETVEIEGATREESNQEALDFAQKMLEKDEDPEAAVDVCRLIRTVKKGR